ncbi:MAG: hypothetical protein KF752_05265 [Pirellulaceae bacterium]|nr:hypothetical protein [Pirellulaceae bacterium]
MSQHEFVISKFRQLHGKLLYDYFSQTIDESDVTVPGDEIQALCSNFDEFDEEHLVYAIEICGKYAIADTITELVELLSNSSLSVCLAVQRALFRADPSLLSGELWLRIQTIKSRLPLPHRESLECTLNKIQESH